MTIRKRSPTSDLLLLLESEALGEATFGVTAGLARKGRHRDIWDALHELEAQTLTAAQSFLAQLPDLEDRRVERRERRSTMIGKPAGHVLCALPWNLQMRILVIGTRRFLPAFERLRGRFVATPSSEFFSYVVDHEVAIREVARRELGNRDDSLAPVERLLGRVPAVRAPL